MLKISKDQLVKLQKRYKTDSAIAKVFGVSRQIIYLLRKEYNIPSLRDKNSIRNMDIKRLYENGVSPMALANKYSLSLTQIYRILNLNKREKMIDTTKRVFTNISELNKVLSPFRKAGKTVISTNGCFDLLHAGHLSYLQEAAELGDILVVGINSDNSVRRLKGESRPLQNEIDRATLMAALKPVDYTIIFEEDDPCNLLEALKPDIHVKGGDYLPEDLPEKEVVEKNGGKIEILSFKTGHSTTTIVDKILSEKRD